MTGENTREWLGQGFAVLLVGGLIALVVWFARGYDADTDFAVVDDAGPTDAEVAATDAGDDAASSGDTGTSREAPESVRRVLFGAVVEEVEGLALEVEQGCVLQADLVHEGIYEVRLRCPDALYTSPRYASPPGEASAASTPDGIVFAIRYSSAADADGVRLSVDTSRERILVRDGSGRARLKVDPWGVGGAGALDDGDVEAGEPAAFDAEGCTLAASYEGRVVLGDEELGPLTYARQPDRVELFDARAGDIDGARASCEDGGVSFTGQDASYAGRLGPAGRSVVGRVELAGESGLFWLVAEAEGSSDGPAP